MVRQNQPGEIKFVYCRLSNLKSIVSYMELILPPVLFTVVTWGIVRLAVARERGREQQITSSFRSAAYPPTTHAKVA